MRWFRHAGTAVIALVIVVGPPLVAGLWMRIHRWRVPTMGGVRGWLEQPPAAGAAAVLIGAMAVAGWLLLAWLIVRRACQVISARVRRLRRLPLPNPAQMTAGSMAGVAALAMPGVVAYPDGGAPASVSTGAELDGVQATTVPAGVELPGGGWVPYRTALAVGLMGGAIWLYRRQHYQPRAPRFGGYRDDDLQPLPGTVEAIMAGTAAEPMSSRVPEAMLLPNLPTGLITLHGPGAMSAARGLLVTTLLAAGLARVPATVVTLRPRDLQVLLGAGITGDLPAGLHLDEALDPFVDAAERVDGSNEPLAYPTLWLMRPSGHVDQSDPAVARRGSGAGEATVVMVGGAGRREGRQWHIAAEGTTVADDCGRVQRLCVLDMPAATDLLLLIQQHSRTAASSPSAGRTVEATASESRAARRPGRLQLLGGCRVEVDGQPVHIRRSAGLQILAHLAVHRDGATTTELVRAIWPGLNPNTITKRLHTTLTDLRQQLHQTLPDVVVRQGERYRLNLDVIDTDLNDLRHAITAATTAVNDHQRLQAAQTITASYPAELAAGYSWPWLHRPRETLRRDIIDAYLYLASTAPPGRVLDLVAAATVVDPYNEALHHEAHRILSEAGEHEVAKHLLQSFTQRLRSAGLRPSTVPDTPTR